MAASASDRLDCDLLANAEIDIGLQALFFEMGRRKVEEGFRIRTFMNVEILRGPADDIACLVAHRLPDHGVRVGLYFESELNLDIVALCLKGQGVTYAAMHLLTEG
ncbi:hypothetical protein D3C87_1624060 [compost metagenome]